MGEARRHEKISEFFLQVCDLTPPEQRAYLERTCADDMGMRADVLALLEEDSRAEAMVCRVSGPKTTPRLDVGPDALDPASSAELACRWSPSVASLPSPPEACPDIPGYQIRSVLGQGGMGVVYRATQLSLGRDVALKVLPSAVGKANPSALARFKREAAAAAKLTHKHIVPIIDFGESSECCFYAMELVSGYPLNVLIRDWAKTLYAEAKQAATDSPASDMSEPVSPEPLTGDSMRLVRPFQPAYFRQVAKWIRDAAEALHFAHEHGIVHRDVKPANLIVSGDGEIVLTDFGIAAADDEEGITKTGNIVGTLRYLSPEQALGGRVPVDRRTDVYSMGATLYELTVLRPASPSGDDKQLLAAVIGQEPAKPSSLQPTVPVDLETICLKALEKLPENRYQTAKDLAEDLAAFLENRSILARRPRITVRMRRFLRRRAAIVLAGAYMVAMAVAALVVAGGHRKTQTDEKVNELISRGLVLQQDQQWNEGAQSYQEALKLDPRNVRALENLAIIRKEQFNSQAQGDPLLLVEANAYCDAALAVAPSNAAIWNVKGVVLKKLGRWADAVAAYQQGLASASDQPEMRIALYDNLAEMHWLNGDYEAGEATVRIAAQVADATGTPAWFAWQDLASLELAQQNPIAVEYIRRGFEAKGGPHWRLHLLRAKLHLVLETHRDVEQAVRDVYAALEQGPPDPRLERTAALAFLYEGALDKSVEHALRGLALGDDPAFSHMILAIAEAQRDNLEAGREHYDKAIEAWPQELRDGEYRVSTERGMLWFDTAQELNSLAKEAEAVLYGAP